MKEIDKIIRDQCNSDLIQITKELSLNTVPIESKLRQICSEIFECKIDKTDTKMFILVSIPLAIELGKRLEDSYKLRES